MKQPFGLRGFLRVKLGEDDENGNPVVVGDSGWVENQITNLGWEKFILSSIGSVTDSLYVKRCVLGVGGIPASNATACPSETRRSTNIGVATSGSFTLQFTTNFVSGTAGGDIDVCCLVNDTASDGTIMCGTSFTSSAWASNQAVSVTYELQKA
jgi:hypothetical protein